MTTDITATAAREALIALSGRTLADRQSDEPCMILKAFIDQSAAVVAERDALKAEVEMLSKVTLPESAGKWARAAERMDANFDRLCEAAVENATLRSERDAAIKARDLMESRLSSIDEARMEARAERDSARSSLEEAREALEPGMACEVMGPNVSPHLQIIFSTEEQMRAASDAIRKIRQPDGSGQ